MLNTRAETILKLTILLVVNRNCLFTSCAVTVFFPTIVIYFSHWKTHFREEMKLHPYNEWLENLTIVIQIEETLKSEVVHLWKLAFSSAS